MWDVAGWSNGEVGNRFRGFPPRVGRAASALALPGVLPWSRARGVGGGREDSSEEVGRGDGLVQSGQFTVIRARVMGVWSIVDVLWMWVMVGWSVMAGWGLVDVWWMYGGCIVDV